MKSGSFNLNECIELRTEGGFDEPGKHFLLQLLYGQLACIVVKHDVSLEIGWVS